MRAEDEEMVGNQGEEWIPEGTHHDYVSDANSEPTGFVPDSGGKSVLVSKHPETYGPAGNKVLRNSDPDADDRDQL